MHHILNSNNFRLYVDTMMKQEHIGTLFHAILCQHKQLIRPPVGRLEHVLEVPSFLR